MSNGYKRHQQDIQHAFYGGQKKKFTKKDDSLVIEGVHIASYSPTGTMGIVRDDRFTSDPAVNDGLELGDEAATIADPTVAIGEVAGFTGFRYTLVRDADGKTTEFPPGSLTPVKPAEEV